MIVVAHNKHIQRLVFIAMLLGAASSIVFVFFYGVYGKLPCSIPKASLTPIDSLALCMIPLTRLILLGQAELKLKANGHVYTHCFEMVGGTRYYLQSHAQQYCIGNTFVHLWSLPGDCGQELERMTKE